MKRLASPVPPLVEIAAVICIFLFLASSGRQLRASMLLDGASYQGTASAVPELMTNTAALAAVRLAEAEAPFAIPLRGTAETRALLRKSRSGPPHPALPLLAGEPPSPPRGRGLFSCFRGVAKRQDPLIHSASRTVLLLYVNGIGLNPRLSVSIAEELGPADSGQNKVSGSESRDTILDRAQHLISQGRLQSAHEELMRGLQRFPHEAAFFNFLGIVDAEQNREQQAESDFHRAITESPRYSGAYLNLGHLYEAESAREPRARSKAIRAYRALLQFDPVNIEANFQLAVLAMQTRGFRDSLTHLERLPAEDRQKVRVLAILCADHAGLDEPQEAMRDASELMASQGLTEADVLSITPVLTAHHQPALALRLLESLVRRHLATGATLTQMGELYDRAGQFQKARRVLEGAATDSPADPQPLIALARIANQQKDYRGALGYLAHARELEPGNAGIHFFFGMVCVELDLHHEAYVSLKKAVALDPDNAYYNYALGAVCTQRQDASEAIPYFKKYCELRPRDPRGVLALGAAYYYAHNLPQARAELQRVAGESVTASAAHYFLGRIANDQGKWPEAVRDLDFAIEEYAHYPDAYAVLGSAYLNERKYAEAEKALAHALKLAPENYLANLNLMILYERRKDPRASAQAQRFAEVRKEREQRAKLFLRTIRVEP